MENGCLNVCRHGGDVSPFNGKYDDVTALAANCCNRRRASSWR